MADSPQAPAPEAQDRTLAEFLESSPRDVVEKVSDLAEHRGNTLALQTPDIQLHCPSEAWARRANSDPL